MGSITLPTSGSVYLDANALIYSVETSPAYWPLLEPVWKAATAGQFRLVSSELVVLEALVIPIRKADQLLLAAYQAVFSAPEVSLVPISSDILREAARLRALHKGVRTPDAIHAATGLLHPPSLFLTNDPDFRKVPGLPVIVLSDLLGP